MRGWQLLVAAGVLAAVATACEGADATGAQSREVLVDYVHDEFAASYLAYFPRDVTMHPGDTVTFRQEWTGEPHSVTMGTMVDDMMGVITPLLEEYAHLPDDEIPPEVFEQFMAATETLPWMLPDDVGGGPVNQNVGQPCYLEEGAPPEDLMQPCTEEQQEQPPFNGRQSYYNSGFIPYEGEQGNTFVVPLADDIEPGDARERPQRALGRRGRGRGGGRAHRSASSRSMVNATTSQSLRSPMILRRGSGLWRISVGVASTRSASARSGRSRTSMTSSRTLCDPERCIQLCRWARARPELGVAPVTNKLRTVCGLTSPLTCASVNVPPPSICVRVPERRLGPREGSPYAQRPSGVGASATAKGPDRGSARARARGVSQPGNSLAPA